MLHMNDYDMGYAIRVFERDLAEAPVAYGAALTLDAFREWVDSHSDGWAHWAPPGRAAKALMTLIQEASDRFDRSNRFNRDARDIDPAALKRAYAQIRAFATRYNRGQYGRNSSPLDFDTLIFTVTEVPA